MSDVSFDTLTTKQLVAAYNALTGKSVGPTAFKTATIAREKVSRVAAENCIPLPIVAAAVAEHPASGNDTLRRSMQTRAAKAVHKTPAAAVRSGAVNAIEKLGGTITTPRDKAIDKRTRLNGGDEFAHAKAEGDVADAEIQTKAALQSGDVEAIKAARDKMRGLGLAEQFEAMCGDVLGEVQNGTVAVVARALNRVQHPPMKAKSGADMPRYGTDKFWIVVMMARTPGGVSHATLQKLTGWQRCTSTPKILARDLGVLASYKREKRDGDSYFSAEWPGKGPMPKERHPLEPAEQSAQQAS